MMMNSAERGVFEAAREGDLQKLLVLLDKNPRVDIFKANPDDVGFLDPLTNWSTCLRPVIIQRLSICAVW